MEALGKRATGPGVVYLTGGATALLLQIRSQTVDIDIKLDPEPAGAFQAIAALKDSLDVNVELASPDQFIPPLPGWQERSQYIARFGQVEFRHFDFYSQALAKIERGHDLDVADATALVARGLVQPGELRRLAIAIQEELIRYPAIDPDDFHRRLSSFLESCVEGE
jgi:hypothetical protein